MRARRSLPILSLLVSIGACSSATIDSTTIDATAAPAPDLTTTTQPSTTTPSLTCGDAADLAIDGLQKFLDRLGEIPEGDVQSLPSAPLWLQAHIDDAQGTDRVIAYFSDDLSDEQLGALATEVGEWDGVVTTTWLSKTEAIAEAFRLFADQPDLLETVEAKPEIIPRSIRTEVLDSATVDVGARFDERQDVVEIVVRDTTAQELAVGLLGTDLVEPALGGPVGIAAELGCVDALWELVIERADQLEPKGSAGRRFIEPLLGAEPTDFAR